MHLITQNRAPKLLGALLLFALFISSGLTATFGSQGDLKVLARVEVTRRLDKIGLPIFAHLSEPNGTEYALTIATQAQLKRSGAQYRVLDTFTQGSEYAVIEPHGTTNPLVPAGTFTVHDDGTRKVVRTNAQQARSLLLLGYHLQWLSDTPMVLREPASAMAALAAIDPHPTVSRIIEQVTEQKVTTYDGNLSGVNAVMVGGSSYTFTTRNTASGTPIQKATQYVYEFMQNQGLSVSYHSWTSGSYSGRNVIGEKQGTTRPNEIVLITAHLDSLPSSGRAPGADDNASGSTGVMLAAELFSPYQFERTVRFVFFTGEEQGLLGSAVYANKMASEGQNLVAVFNMDMISTDAAGGPDMRLFIRSTSSPGYAADKAIADTFVGVRDAYGLSTKLTPYITANNFTRSDHASFWNKGFAGLLASEYYPDDFSAYYHQSTDELKTLNITFFTNMVKASLGTVAHLIVPSTSTTPTPVTITPTPVTRTPTPVTRTPTPVTPTPLPGILFADDFETNKGWATNAGGTDTATTGQWERGDPEATDSTGPKQLGTTTSGMNDLVTGRLAGSGAGSYDLDGGVTSIRSPGITLAAGSNASLSFKYYLAHGSNAGSDDYFRVKVIGSSTSTVFERLGAASNLDAAWQSATVNLNSFAGQTIRIQFEAADAGTASLIEAAVDDVVVNGSSSTTPTPVTPSPTPITPSPTVGTGPVFSDDFESSTGWTANPNGSDTATLGQWERGDPEATDYSGPKQLGSTASGTNDLVTGRLAGSGPGAYDLDGGVTSIRSQAITLPSTGNLVLSFKYYLAHANNAGSDDYFRVKIVGSTTTTVFERLGAASNLDASWQIATVNLNAYAGQMVRILIEAADAGTGSLVEAAVDDVSISR